MGSPEKEDAAAHLSSLVNTSVPSMETNYSLARVQGVPYPQVIQGERSLYRLPATGGGPATLLLLIRAWPGGLPHNHAQDPFMWTSSCELDITPSPPPACNQSYKSAFRWRPLGIMHFSAVHAPGDLIAGGLKWQQNTNANELQMKYK